MVFKHSLIFLKHSKNGYSRVIDFMQNIEETTVEMKSYKYKFEMFKISSIQVFNKIE